MEFIQFSFNKQVIRDFENILRIDASLLDWFSKDYLWYFSSERLMISELILYNW